MPTAARSSARLPGPRNAFAVSAHRLRASFFKDRRAPRGGSQNWERHWLDELLDEPTTLDAPEPVSER